MTPEEISNAFPASQASAVENPAVVTTPPSMPPVEQPPALETPPPPKSNKKLFLVIGIVILLLVLVAAGVFAFMKMQKPSPRIIDEGGLFPPSSTPEAFVEDDMSDWETYTNDEYSFSIQYPNTFEVVDDISGWPHAILILYKGSQSYDLVVEAWETKTDYEAQYADRLDTLVVKDVDGRFITLLNINQDPEVDQILSTFEFVEDNGWETYTNTEYKYSINYPSDWKTENVAAGNTAPSALPNSRAIDISSDQIELGMLSIQYLQSMPTLPEGFTQSQETIGSNSFTVWTTNIHSMISKTYFIDVEDGILEILIRPIFEDNEQIYQDMLESFKVQ